MTVMPTPRTVAAAASYVALAVTDTVLAGSTRPGAQRARRVVKPLLMPALGVAFRSGTRGTGDPLHRGTAAAQALSWAGDVALLSHREPAFLAGVGAFAGAHVAYATGFSAARDRRPGRDLAGVRIAVALFATAGPAIAAAARGRSRRLGAPVAGYAAVLATMFGTSTLLDPARPAGARRTVRAGTALFLASDTLLGLQEFVLPRRSPRLERAVMATYTAGQGLIAWGAARA